MVKFGEKNTRKFCIWPVDYIITRVFYNRRCIVAGRSGGYVTLHNTSVHIIIILYVFISHKTTGTTGNGGYTRSASEPDDLASSPRVHVLQILHIFDNT